MSDKVIVGAHYTHYKGGIYQVICIAKIESTSEDVVVYFSTNNYQHYVRPVTEFMEKFKLTNNLHNMGKQRKESCPSNLSNKTV